MSYRVYAYRLIVSLKGTMVDEGVVNITPYREVYSSIVIEVDPTITNTVLFIRYKGGAYCDYDLVTCLEVVVKGYWYREDTLSLSQYCTGSLLDGDVGSIAISMEEVKVKGLMFLRDLDTDRISRISPLTT